MGKRTRIITEIEKNEIVKLYLEDNFGITPIATKHKLGKLKIKKILNNRGVKLKKRGGKINDDLTKKIKNFIPSLNKPSKGKVLIAVCNSTGKIILDYNNRSGGLSKHLMNLGIHCDIPSNTYQRNKYFIENNKQWYEKYFTINEIDLKKTRKCELCNWETIDIKNKSGVFENHLVNKHNISLEQYLEKFPKEIKYHPVYAKKLENNLFLNNKDNFIICEICGKKMKSINNTHLKKHNITPQEYKEKYGNLLSKKTHKIFSDNFNDASLLIKKRFTSKAEIEIKEFVKSLGLTILSNNRKLLKGVELDIVIPNHHLAIEYNGLYYHQEKMGKNRYFHLNKTLLSNSIGYGLIHIFEDEWVSNKNLIKNKLIHILGLSNSNKIGARECIIKEINNKEKSPFLNNYHIQGNDKSNIKLGAFYNNILIGVMTFKNKRIMTKNLNKGGYELSRFATHDNYIINGLPSKILKYFIKNYNPNNIISFADRRWTLDPYDNMYTKMGFKLMNIGKPNYWYYNSSVNRLKRFHKFGFGKSSLKKKHPNLDFLKTEKELTIELGYDRIWDCGLFKYEIIFR